MSSLTLMVAAALVGLVGLSSWAQPTASARDKPSSGQASPPPTIISLARSLDPIRKRFNEHQDKARFISLLSATCPACLAGAQAIRESILDAQPDADLSVSIIWIDMLKGDNPASVADAASKFDDPRVAQFHDPQRRAGRAFAEGVLKRDGGPAWDIYLFYAPGAQWNEAPARPMDWIHQLSGEERADPARFRTGKALGASLGEMATRLLEKSARTKGHEQLRAEPVGSPCCELLTIPSCPMASELRERARNVVARFDGTMLVEIDLASLPVDDPRRGYGSPTLLVGGVDVTGAGRPAAGGGLSCRLYPNGLPTEDTIAALVRDCLGGADPKKTN